MPLSDLISEIYRMTPGSHTVCFRTSGILGQFFVLGLGLCRIINAPGIYPLDARSNSQSHLVNASLGSDQSEFFLAENLCVLLWYVQEVSWDSLIQCAHVSPLITLKKIFIKYSQQITLLSLFDLLSK